MNIKFETERLYFRPFELSDAEDFLKMDSNPNVHKYLWQKPTKSIEEMIEVIQHLQKQYDENKIGRYATFLKDSGEFIGWTGIKFINDHVENGNTNFYDYGYRLNEPFWNKGYATEATRFWLDYGINQMNVEDINAYTHYQNAASNKVLDKCGMNFREEYTAEDGVKWNWWQLLKSDFRN